MYQANLSVRAAGGPILGVTCSNVRVPAAAWAPPTGHAATAAAAIHALTSRSRRGRPGAVVASRDVAAEARTSAVLLHDCRRLVGLLAI